jgi:hypothetical protein
MLRFGIIGTIEVNVYMWMKGVYAMVLPGWFWGALFVLGGLWYVFEPIFLYLFLSQEGEERETDPLLAVVDGPEQEK